MVVVLDRVVGPPSLDLVPPLEDKPPLEGGTGGGDVTGVMRLPSVSVWRERMSWSSVIASMNSVVTCWKRLLV